MGRAFFIWSSQIWTHGLACRTYYVLDPICPNMWRIKSKSQNFVTKKIIFKVNIYPSLKVHNPLITPSFQRKLPTKPGSWDNLIFDEILDPSSPLLYLSKNLITCPLFASVLRYICIIEKIGMTKLLEGERKKIHCVEKIFQPQDFFSCRKCTILGTRWKTGATGSEVDI